MMQKLNLSFEDKNLILGVNPDQRIDLFIFYYGIEIMISVHNSIEELVFHIIRILGDFRTKRKILKIGDENIHVAKQIAKMLNLKYYSSFKLEFVDERKTSMKIKNFNH